MLIKRLYDQELAQASWLVGCPATGEALVVDPNRDVERYLAVAAAERLRIRHVAETHIHADFVSGLRELVVRTGAKAYLSGEGGAEWSYGFAGELEAELLFDGSEFRVGKVVVRAVHTPGHTPEHLCFMVTDTAGADQPMGVFTGDFVFVGDIGRPDLLEKAAGAAGTMEASARRLYASLQRFRTWPDWLQLWPGHGAGSVCGKSLGAVPQSTLGYERLFNWGLAARSEGEFVAAVLSGQPEPPRYFAEMKRVNREGPALLGGFTAPPRLRLEELDAEALLLDVRRWPEFRRGHLPGSINIPLSRSFSTYAGSVLPAGRELELIAGGEAEAARAAKRLAMIGLERVSGYLDGALLPRPRERGGLAELQEVTAARALELAGSVDAVVLDVRGRSEWEEARAAGGRVWHVPLGELPERAMDLPRDQPLLVYCKTGARSAIAASILAARGVRDVRNVRGGLDAWHAAGGAVVHGGTA